MTKDLNLEPSMPDLDPDRLMIDPPSGWRYGFPKRIPREHQHRATEWMIEQGYPRIQRRASDG